MPASTSTSASQDNLPTVAELLKSSEKDSQGDEKPKIETDRSKPETSSDQDEAEILKCLMDKRGRSKFPHMDGHRCIRVPSKKPRPSIEISSGVPGLFTPPTSSTKPQAQPTSTTQKPSSPEEGEIAIPQLYPTLESREGRSLTSEDEEYLLKYGCIRAAPNQKRPS